MGGGPGSNDPGRIAWPAVSLLSVLTRAYGVSSDQVSGPGWLSTEMCSIVATIPPKTDEPQFRLMLQRLLAERFHLTLHHSTKELPVYELVVANTGPKMKPYRATTGGATTSPSTARPPGPVDLDKQGFPVLPAGEKLAMSIGAGMVRGTFRITMADFAKELKMPLALSIGEMPKGSILEKTGLAGEFDFMLEFAQRPKSDADGSSDPAGGPNLFSALEKQLGLRLQKGKQVLDLLVIDHIDKVPTEN